MTYVGGNGPLHHTGYMYQCVTCTIDKAVLTVLKLPSFLCVVSFLLWRTPRTRKSMVSGPGRTYSEYLIPSASCDRAVHPANSARCVECGGACVPP